MLNPKNVSARQAMNEDVITLREDATISEAIQTLEDYHITGAPVVNALGECIGVFTTADVLKRDRQIEEGEVASPGTYFSQDPFSEEEDGSPARDGYDEEVLGRDTVGQWMTSEVKAVRPEATIAEVCQLMLDERIHRLLVMEGKRLLGIITSFDMVALLAGQGNVKNTLVRRRH